MRFSQLQFQNVCTLGTRKCVVRSRGARLFIPTSNVAVPHTEQTGRTTASECAVAGSKTITGPVSSSSTLRPANTSDLSELNNHRTRNVRMGDIQACVDRSQACRLARYGKPHLTPTPWAWREINRLERIMNMRLLHSVRSH